MITRRRKIIVGVVLVVIGLPVALALAVTVFLNILNPVLLNVSNQTSGTIVSSGQKREYLLHIPRSYDRAKAAPLVISMHAAALWPAAQMETSQWNKVADQHGFIVVYPSGTGMAPLPFLPSLPVWPMKSEAGRTANVRFISELIDALEAAYDIDPTRIYVNGLSNGGGMAFVLSCTLSQRIAAVGTVAAAQELPWSWCQDSRPVPMIAFHGTADRVVPYNGGSSPLSPIVFPSVPAWTAAWARRNGCGPNPVESVGATDVTRVEYTNCAEDAAVVLYTVRGGGHSWPGGKPMPEWLVGSTSSSIDATEQMWAFFRERRLPRTQPGRAKPSGSSP
jgi:polyhydroxybutyrate depolymerase